jgi:hypothetical protein
MLKYEGEILSLWQDSVRGKNAQLLSPATPGHQPPAAAVRPCCPWEPLGRLRNLRRRGGR